MPRTLNSLLDRLAGLRYVQEAMAEQASLEIFSKPPSIVFLAGLSLIGLSYVIGWPAVAFFAFLAAWRKSPELALWGPTSYLISHVVFLIGMAVSGPDTIRYGNAFLKWAIRTWVGKKLKPVDQ